MSQRYHGEELRGAEVWLARRAQRPDGCSTEKVEKLKQAKPDLFVFHGCSRQPENPSNINMMRGRESPVCRPARPWSVEPV